MYAGFTAFGFLLRLTVWADKVPVENTKNAVSIRSHIRVNCLFI
jgi:hypothetical protein